MNIRSLFAFAVAGTLAVAAANASASTVLVRPDGIYVRCDQCGTVVGIEQNVTQGSGHGTAGAIIGAIGGAVLGNQIGRGGGRTLATVAGGVGGGFAGNAIGNHTGGGSVSYTLRLKMGNGGYTNATVKDASGIRQGDIVAIDGQGNISPVR